MNTTDLLREALRLDRGCVVGCFDAVDCGAIAFVCKCGADAQTHVHVGDDNVVTMGDVYLTAIANGYTGAHALDRFMCLRRTDNICWSRLDTMGYWTERTYTLYATLLLGMHRVVGETHWSMVEEMLESWRFCDSLELE